MKLTGFFRRETVALLIEETHLRLTGVSGDQVTRWGSASIPQGVITRGVVRQPDALGETIRNLFEAHSASRSRVVAGISGIGTASRIIPLSPDDDPPTPEAIRAAAERLLPSRGGHLAWQIVEQGEQREVFVLVTPRASLDSHLEGLAAAGIHPLAVDLKPLALVRAVGQRNAMIADLEHTLLTLAIVEAAIPRQVRVLPLDFASVRRPEDKVVRVVEELQRLIRLHNVEIRRGGDGHARTLIHAAMPVWVSGSLAEHPLLRAAIRDALEHPCVVAPTSLVSPDEFPVAQYLACLGLAMKQV